MRAINKLNLRYIDVLAAFVAILELVYNFVTNCVDGAIRRGRMAVDLGGVGQPRDDARCIKSMRNQRPHAQPCSITLWSRGEKGWQSRVRFAIVDSGTVKNSTGQTTDKLAEDICVGV